MPIDSAYATVAEFRSRVQSTATDDDPEIASQLLAASRYVESLCGRTFNKDLAVTTRIYDGGPAVSTQVQLLREVTASPVYARTRLYLEHDIATTTGLIVQVDLDGDYVQEQTLTLNTHFWVGPWNATVGAEPRPYRFLEVVPTNNPLLNAWPSHRRAIKVTAIHGWPGSPPGAVREAVVMIVRQLRDLQEAGAAEQLMTIESAGMLVDKDTKLITKLLKEYGRQRSPRALFA